MEFHIHWPTHVLAETLVTSWAIRASTLRHSCNSQVPSNIQYIMYVQQGCTSHQDLITLLASHNCVWLQRMVIEHSLETLETEGAQIWIFLLQDLCTKSLTHLRLENNDITLHASASLQSLQWMSLVDPKWERLKPLENFVALTALTLSVADGYLLIGDLGHCLRNLTLLRYLNLTHVIGENQSMLQPFTHLKQWASSDSIYGWHMRSVKFENSDSPQTSHREYRELPYDLKVV